jgi:hypothetical protein
MAILTEKDRKDFVKLFGEYLRVENLNQEAAKRYITASLKREYASENGTELNSKRTPQGGC